MLEEYAPWLMDDLMGPHAQGRGYYMRPAEKPQIPDTAYSDSAGFWRDVLHEKITAERVVRLDGFNLFDWVPRNPGLFYTANAKGARDEAQQFVLDRYDHGERLGRDAADSFRRTTSRWLDYRGASFATTRTFLYAPMGKVAMLTGGVGCVRYKPIELKSGGVVWLMSASSELAPDTGIPMMVPDHLYQKLATGLHEAGGVQCDIVGKTRFVSGEFSDLFSVRRGIQRLYVEVSDVRIRREIVDQADVSVAVSFFSRYEGKPKIYAAYVTFDPKLPGAKAEAAQWMRDEYVIQLYGGHILTDFDQRAPIFSDALFTLDQVMTTPSLAEKIGKLIELYGDFDWAQLDRFSYVEREGDVVVTSNTYNVSGSQNVVINSKLEGTSLIVNNMPAGNDAQKNELKELLEQLTVALAATSEKKSEAEAVATQAKSLVEETAKPRPNKTLLKTYGDMLRSTASLLKMWCQPLER